MDIKITIPIAIILLSGCTSKIKPINNCKSGIPGNCPACTDLTIVDKQKIDTTIVSRPPPFWPPHEHITPHPGVMRWDSQIQLLESRDDHWNHITFELDPTTIDIQ